MRWVVGLALAAVVGLGPVGAGARVYLDPSEQVILDNAQQVLSQPVVGDCHAQVQAYWSGIGPFFKMAQKYQGYLPRAEGVRYDEFAYIISMVDPLFFQAGDRLLASGCASDALRIYKIVFDSPADVVQQNKAMERMQEARDALAKRP